MSIWPWVEMGERHTMTRFPTKQYPTGGALSRCLFVLVLLLVGLAFQAFAAQPGSPAQQGVSPAAAHTPGWSVLPPAPPGPYTPIPDALTGGMATDVEPGMAPYSGPNTFAGQGTLSGGVGASVHGSVGMRSLPHQFAGSWVPGTPGYPPAPRHYIRPPIYPGAGHPAPYPPMWPGYGAYGSRAPPGVGRMHSPYWRPPIGPAW